MSRVDVLYRWLARSREPAADEILAAALAHAEPAYAVRIATILVDRRRTAAWAGLVGSYDRLPAELQERVRRQPEMLRAGIGVAIRMPARAVRQNALTLLAEYPCPQLAYLVVDALRDSAQPVRKAAAHAMRRLAEHVLHEAEDQRPELLRALREALRTFERHGCLEVLETCLWFAKDLGEALWEALAEPHTRCGYLVEQNLSTWSHPRLAGFLLLGMARPAWRRAAQALLESWRAPEQIAAILQNSDLLADPQVRRGLLLHQRPGWFLVAGSVLPKLPPAARAQLPYWVCHLGFTEEERVRYLDRATHSQWPEVQRSAAYALATLDHPEAAQIITRLAATRSPAMYFARWYVAGQRALAAAVADAARGSGRAFAAHRRRGGGEVVR